MDLLAQWRSESPATNPELPAQLPEHGIGDRQALQRLAPWVIGHSARLDAPDALAHMDPPTPWVTWAASLWNASLNQNLLHAMTSPAAQEVERMVLRWLCPWFGMTGGLMLPGSTLANLTALWAARETKNVRRVVASGYAHVSVRKAAHLLGLEFVEVKADEGHALRADKLTDLRDCALVLTAGTTASGAIDPLDAGIQAAWRHVDAAWAGPLALSERYRSRLQGIEKADSVAVSAHKWFFQPKESALVMFREWDQVSPALSFGGGYLASPNVGLLGSHAATAVPLLATLMAWGKEGLAQRIERCMETSDTLAVLIEKDDRFVLLAPSRSGVLLWRRAHGDTAALAVELSNIVSSVTLEGKVWLRSVSANPNADAKCVYETVCQRIETGQV